MNTTVDHSFGSPPLDGLQYTLSLSLGTLIVFAIIAYISYTCKRIRDEATIRNRYSLDGDYGVVTFKHKGLDEATLSSFPRFTYSNLKPHDSIASACSVCLADYVDDDLLRLLPHCGHFFHVECIDSWLVVQSTCPICRYSPLAPPASVPV